MDIVVWLRSLGLGKYEAAFRENEIDKTVLPSLTDEHLKELGVTALGPRRKLLDAIAALRSDAGVMGASAAAGATSSTPSALPEDRAERRQVTVMSWWAQRHSRLARILKRPCSFKADADDCDADRSRNSSR